MLREKFLYMRIDFLPIWLGEPVRNSADLNRLETIANNDNPGGLSTTTSEIEIETTPEHLNLISGDPDCATWVRSHDDRGVVELREHLRRDNGIKGLEPVSPNDRVSGVAFR